MKNISSFSVWFFAALILGASSLVGGCAYKQMVSGYDMKMNFTGQVVDAINEKGLQGVPVSLLPPGSQKTATATTDEMGFFEMKDVVIGKLKSFGGNQGTGGLVTVRVEYAGYKPFANKYPIQGMAAVGAALTSTNIGVIKIEKQ
jgi:hypothetical protein